MGVGDTLEKAEHIAGVGILNIIGPLEHRPDIGTRSLIDERIKHMAILRGTY